MVGRYMSANDITVLTTSKEECMLQMIHHWKWIPNSVSDIKKGQEKLTFFFPCCTEYNRFSPPGTDRK